MLCRREHRLGNKDPFLSISVRREGGRAVWRIDGGRERGKINRPSLVEERVEFGTLICYGL